MRTSDLIELIAQDTAARQKAPHATIALWLALGACVSAAIYLLAIHWRPDIAEAARTLRFLLKFAIMIPLAVGAIGLVTRLARPATPVGPWPWLMAAPAVLLLCAVAVELVVVPGADWLHRLVGTNWYFCLSLIPLLSMGPLAGLLFALKSGAPENPGLAGAVAGLAAGGLAASLYASHCTDDSPLFVVTWYTLAIGGVTLVGFVAGRRVLRW